MPYYEQEFSDRSRERNRGGHNRKRRRKRKNGRGALPLRAIVITAAAVAVIAAVVLTIVLTAGKKGVTRLGAMAFSLNTNSVIVRDETCYSADKQFDRAIYLVDEGETVRLGTPLARLYTWGYTDDVMQAVFDAESNITDMQYEMFAGIDISDVDAIDMRIHNLIDELRKNIFGIEKTRSTHVIEFEIKDAIAERTALLASKTQATEELNRLYSIRTEKEELLNEWASNIVAGEDGRVSFYFDGYEQSINLDKLDILTDKLITDALSNGKSYSAVSNSLIYKIVDDTNWCVVFVTDGDSPNRLTEGETYKVTFRGYDKTFTATALKVSESKKKVINVLKFTDSMGDFISTRVLSMSIVQEFSGIRVETDAIVYDEGIPYVSIVSLGGVTQSIQVEILAEENGLAIIRPRDESITIHEGQDYIIP